MSFYLGPCNKEYNQSKSTLELFQAKLVFSYSEIACGMLVPCKPTTSATDLFLARYEKALPQFDLNIFCPRHSAESQRSESEVPDNFSYSGENVLQGGHQEAVKRITTGP